MLHWGMAGACHTGVEKWAEVEGGGSTGGESACMLVRGDPRLLSEAEQTHCSAKLQRYCSRASMAWHCSAKLQRYCSRASMAWHCSAKSSSASASSSARKTSSS
jgi:hypothetical protein